MVIAVILSFQVPYHYRVISGIMQFIRTRREIQLWLPDTNIISQEPAEAVDVGIGTREKQVAAFLPAAAKTVIVSSCLQPDCIQVCSDNTVLSQIAEQPLARRALERAFKEDMGESPMRYLQFLRLQQVRYLLSTTNLTVTEIGRRCAIPDVNYLCRVFRNLFDQTPGWYRQQNWRKPETR